MGEGEGTVEQVLAGEATWCVVTGQSVARRTGAPAELAKLPAMSVDHFIGDPPYSPEVHNKSRGAGARKTARGHLCVRERDFGFECLKPGERRGLSREAARLTRRWALIFCDTESVHLWRRDLMRSGLEAVRVGFWEKLACTPQLTGDRPAVATEAIVIAHRPGQKLWNAGGKRGIWKHRIVGGGEHNAAESRVHTAQKPVPLMIELLEDFTDSPELVVDPTCGSGTTGVAAIRLGRRFIGYERDARYADVARERLRAEETMSNYAARSTGQAALFAGATP